MDMEFAVLLLVSLIVSCLPVECMGSCDGVQGSTRCGQLVSNRGADFCLYSWQPLLQECLNGFCECTNPDYSRCTCLPNVGGCEIELNSGNHSATPKFAGQEQSTIYSCVPDSENPNYEVHVLGNYEGDGHTGFRQHNTGNTAVNILGPGSNKPIILILSTYEPVNWILDFSDPNTVIQKVILFAYHMDNSRVTYEDGRVVSIDRRGDIACGYGDDKGGCHTVELLNAVFDVYGAVTSFSGTYKADEWNLQLDQPREVSVSCGFEDSDICGYSQATEDEFNWERRTGYSGLFGPSASDTYREGSYMKAGFGAIGIPHGGPSVRQSDKARLISPSYTATSHRQCLSFNYQCTINGNSRQTSGLNIYTMAESELGESIWSRPRCNDRIWHLAEIDITGQTVSSYKVVFEIVHSGRAYTGYQYTNMAIDDVILEEGLCDFGTPDPPVNQLRCFCNDCESSGNTCITDGSCYGEKVVIGRREQYSFRCVDQVVMDAAPYLCQPLSGQSFVQTVTVCCHDRDMCNLRIISDLPERPAQTTEITPPPTTIPPTQPYYADKPGSCPDLDNQHDASCDYDWQCNHDIECVDDMKCCFSGCGTICTRPAGRAEPKPGRCPAFGSSVSGICQEDCSRDDDCPHNEKCCFTECGHVCVDAIPDVPLEVVREQWTRRGFTYDDSYTSCTGAQYIKLSGYDVGRYVGVNLCSPTRYKIFLSDDLDGVFLNVADSSGHGQDHCEFLGGLSEATSIDNAFWGSPSATGYYRSRWGQELMVGNIGGGTGETWTGKFYVKWIECGLNIP